MNYSFGPFNLIYLLLFLFVLYLISGYFVIKKKLGMESVLLIFLFPFFGAIIVIVYSLLNRGKVQ